MTTRAKLTLLARNVRADLRAFRDRIFRIEEINGHGICPTYLYRWTLLKIGKLLSVYLHKFVGDDWSLDLHDHPKRFWSIGLRGWYIEHTPCPHGPRLCDRSYPHDHGRMWSAPWLRTFPAEHIHRLTGPTPERPCWTLVIVGLPVRQWGFWHGGRFIHWKQYVNSTAAKDARSCP